MTLDEWKAQQVKKEGPKFNVRKPGEGQKDDPKWKKATIYKKENEEESEEEEEEEVNERWPKNYLVFTWICYRLSTSREPTGRRRSTSTSPLLMSLAEVVEVPAEDAEAVVVEVSVARAETVAMMASAANVVSALSVASVKRMAAVTVEPPAVEDPVEDMEESVELHEEAAAETVEVAEAAAKSSASTKTLSPPWDKPPRR